MTPAMPLKALHAVTNFGSKMRHQYMRETLALEMSGPCANGACMAVIVGLSAHANSVLNEG